MNLLSETFQDIATGFFIIFLRNFFINISYNYIQEISSEFVIGNFQGIYDRYSLEYLKFFCMIFFNNFCSRIFS